MKLANYQILELVPEWLLKSESYFVVITDLDNNYLFVNDFFKKRFSYLSQEFEGYSVLPTVHPDDLSIIGDACVKCISNPGKTEKVKIRKPDKETDKYFWSQWEMSAVFDEEKNAVAILCIGHDNSDTEMAIENARLYSDKIDHLIDHISEGYFVIGRDWKIAKFNKVAEILFKAKREEIIGKNFWDIVPDSPNLQYPVNFKKAMEEFTTLSFEEYNKDTGSYYHVVVSPFLEGLNVFFKDITFEKKAQFKLKDSENKLRAILNSTSDANILLSPDLKVLSFNKEADRLITAFLGKKIKEGDNYSQYILYGTDKKFKEHYLIALDGSTTYFETEYKYNDINCWFLYRFFPVLGEDGKIYAVSFNATNIDSRKRSEIAFKESEEKFRKIILTAPFSIFILDTDMRIMISNAESRKVFGYHESVLFGKHIHMLLPERYHVNNPLFGENYLNIKQPTVMGKECELYAVKNGGEEFPVEVTLNAFELRDKKFTVVIVQDISERKAVTDKLKNQNQALMAIAWKQSHQVRRPVASILGMINIMEMEKEKGYNEMYFDFLKKATVELDEIIHNIIDRITHAGVLNQQNP